MSNYEFWTGEIIEISIIPLPSLVIFDTGKVVLIDFTEISIKSTRNMNNTN